MGLWSVSAPTHLIAVEGDSMTTPSDELYRRREARRAAALRSYHRSKGKDIPLLRPLGTKEVANRIASARRGADNHNWTGDKVTDQAGRKRAWVMYPNIGPCANCGRKRSERHHIDGNTANNDPSNIAIVCRRCHLAIDGRTDDSIYRLNLIATERRGMTWAQWKQWKKEANDGNQ